MDRKSLGSVGEEFVKKYLQNTGFKILAQNFMARCGEIDLIALKNDLVVFVEVKTRSEIYFPTSEVITKSKQIKIIKTAQKFIISSNFSDKIYRFDIATVKISKNNEFQLDYIPDAFRNNYV